MATSEAGEGKPQSATFRIGYALAPKKVHSFIQPSLLNFAAQRGLQLIQIDPHKPLIEQGPFDCIIHKLSGPEWASQLNQYSAANPAVPIVDPLPAIGRLHNRISMLEVVNCLKISDLCQPVSYGVPHQVFVETSRQLFTIQDINFPVIAKPLVADGSADSHQMSLVFNKRGLEELQPPLVLQEFVNHGGVLFKVYVAGYHVQCVKRKSLPDISEEKLATFTSQDVLPFSQISNLAVKEDDEVSKLIDAAEMPPLNFINELANALKNALRLRLFNFDVIKDGGIGNRFLIIDINYFPGYAKMPSYEAFLTDFFLDVVRQSKIDSESEEEAAESDSYNKGH